MFMQQQASVCCCCSCLRSSHGVQDNMCCLIPASATALQSALLNVIGRRLLLAEARMLSHQHNTISRQL
jgi:hypothetical protein